MTISEKLYELRKSKNLSQEEEANLLGVSRQTVSKWETGQSTPDFDKINPICELFGVTPNELFGDNTEPVQQAEEYTPEPIIETNPNNSELNKKRAILISLSVVTYFIAVVWIIISVAFLNVNAVLATGIFLLIIAAGVCMDIYCGIAYKSKADDDVPKTKSEAKAKQVNEILASIVLIAYLLVSFLTGAWSITWIMWIVYALLTEVIKLCFSLKEDKNEK